jgi:hypothetical protein
MIQAGFYTLTGAVFLALIFVIKNHIAPRKSIVRYLAICAIWMAYLSILSATGVLDNFGLPPRVVLLVVLPAIAGIIFFSGRKSFRVILQQTPLHLPVYLQSFRIIVELLIYGAFVQGIFPEKATFNGMNYDILVGISSLIMGAMVQRDKIKPIGLLVWNVVSLVILSVTAYSFISTYYFTDYLATNPGGRSFVHFPFLFLAAVLLPAAVFLHVFSLRQVIGKLRTGSPLTNRQSNRDGIELLSSK